MAIEGAIPECCWHVIKVALCLQKEIHQMQLLRILHIFFLRIFCHQCTGGVTPCDENNSINLEKFLTWPRDEMKRGKRSILAFGRVLYAMKSLCIDKYDRKDSTLMERRLLLYVLVMSHTRFRLNPHSIVAWMPRNSLLEAGANSEV